MRGALVGCRALTVVLSRERRQIRRLMSPENAVAFRRARSLTFSSTFAREFDCFV